MAFHDALRPTDGATVVLNVDTSQTAKLERAEREVAESMQTMSRSALKLELANERAVKAMARYGPEAAQTKRALIGLKDAEEAAARSADKLTTETRQLNSAQDRQRRGMSSMTKGVLGLAGAYVGVSGLIAGVRTVVSAYREQEVVQGQTRIGVNALGIAYDGHADKIDRVVRAVSKLGFDDEALYQSFLKLVRGTKDVDVALERMALAAGVSRGTFNDLEQGTNIVVKAQLGMSGALRRAGLDVEKNASRTELLTFLTEQFGQSAVKAADDGAVAGERFAVEWENLQEILGSGVSPALADVSTRLADYLGDAENQRRIQEQVNEIMETGEEVVRGFAGAFRFLNNNIAGPLRSLGILDEVVKTLLIGFAVGKVLSFANALRLVGTNARFAAGGLAAMSGASATAGRGGVPLLLGISPLTILAALGIAGYYGSTTGQGDAIDGGEFAKLQEAARTGFMTRANLESLRPFLTKSQYTTLAGILDQRQGVGAAGSPDSRGGMVRGGGPGKRPKSPGGGGPSGPTLDDLLLNVARPGNERADLQALRAFYARQIRALDAKKNLTKEQKQKLATLYGELAGVQSQIDALDEDARQRDEERDRKRKEAERKTAERERQRMNRILDAAERRADKRGELFEGIAGRSGSRAGLRALALRGVDATVKGLKDADKPLTAKELREELNRLIRDLNSLREFGSNFAPDGMGQVATQSYAQTQELREQSRQLGMLVRGQWHPGAWYAGNELAVAGTGVGY